MSQIIYKKINEYSIDVAALVIALTEEINYDYVIDDINKSLKELFSLSAFYCVGAYDDNKLIGVLGFLILPEIYNYNYMTASEQFWYVLPSHRRGVGIKLVKYIEESIKADKITFGVSNPKLLQLLQHNGYEVEKTLISKVL